MDASHARSWTTLALAAGALGLTAPAALAARPSITGGSRVAGTAEVGRTLKNTARWSGHPTVRYSWLRCTDVDLASPCTPVAGARTRTYRVAAADAGTFLRSRVRVSNAAGWASVTSAPSRRVIAPPATPPPPSSPPATPAPRFLHPFPVVRIRGWLTSAGVEIRALTVRAPAGARITVRCAGNRCPR